MPTKTEEQIKANLERFQKTMDEIVASLQRNIKEVELLRLLEVKL